MRPRVGSGAVAVGNKEWDAPVARRGRAWARRLRPAAAALGHRPQRALHHRVGLRGSGGGSGGLRPDGPRLGEGIRRLALPTPAMRRLLKPLGRDGEHVRLVRARALDAVAVGLARDHMRRGAAHALLALGAARAREEPVVLALDRPSRGVVQAAREDERRPLEHLLPLRLPGATAPCAAARRQGRHAARGGRGAEHAGKGVAGAKGG